MCYAKNKYWADEVLWARKKHKDVGFVITFSRLKAKQFCNVIKSLK